MRADEIITSTDSIKIIYLQVKTIYSNFGGRRLSWVAKIGFSARIGRLPVTAAGNLFHSWIVVVDFLFIVIPIVGFCNCSMFCCMLLYVHSSIAIVSS